LDVRPEIFTKLIQSIFIFIVLWLLRRWFLRVVVKKIADVRIRYQWQKNSTYFFYILAGLFLGLLWLSSLRNLATYLGLLSAGLAIALRDPVTNFVGWLFILWRHPFEVGDRIEIGDHAGDVIDLRIFQFTLLEIGNWVEADQSTGRMIHVPNGMVFTHPLENFSQGFQYIWNEIPVLLTFESDWQKAKKLLLEIVTNQSEQFSPDAAEQIKKAAERFMIFYETLTPTVYTRVEASGVLLTIRYMCRPQARRTSAETIWEAILLTFAEHEDIGFAYPTQRFYNAPLEGKGQTEKLSQSTSI
jgi:small-conductance mechanosensitive channel